MWIYSIGEALGSGTVGKSSGSYPSTTQNSGGRPTSLPTKKTTLREEILLSLNDFFQELTGDQHP